MEDVLLENIVIDYEGGGDKSIANFGIDSLQKVPENMAGYPEFSMFGELPAWGFYVRHVDGLTTKNIQLNLDNKDYRVATIFDDVKRLELNGVKVSAPKSEPVIVLNNVTQFISKGLELPVEESKAIKFYNK